MKKITKYDVSKGGGHAGTSTSVLATINVNGAAGSSDHATEADHAKKADTASKSDYATEAGHAQSADQLTAQALTEFDERYLSKLDDDTAAGLITFLKGLKLGDGTYGITEEGVATLKSLLLDAGLTVNGASITGGITNFGDITNIGDITTENLTVTGLAHFFKVIIDEIKSAGGSLMLTPADGFVVDYIEEGTVNYLVPGYTDPVSLPYKRLWWKKTDGSGRTRHNMWQEGDQAFCKTTNLDDGKGTLSNKQWWGYVLGAGEDKCAIDGTTYDCNYIDVCTDTKQSFEWPVQGGGKAARTMFAAGTGFSSPSAIAEQDNVVQLGHRATKADMLSDGSNYNWTDIKSRGGATYIASYASADVQLVAPLLAFYKGIDNFDLLSHRGTYIATKGIGIPNARFVGSIAVEGEDESQSDILQWKGIWDASATYYNNMEVSYDGQLYYCTGLEQGKGISGDSNSPASNTTNWKVIVSKGGRGKDGLTTNPNLIDGSRFNDPTAYESVEFNVDSTNTYEGDNSMKWGSEDGYVEFKKVHATAGNTYTFSVYVWQDGDSDEGYITDGTQRYTFPIPPEDTWTRVSYTFVWNEQSHLEFGVNIGGGDTWHFAHPKLEEGTEATPWCLSENDKIGEKGEAGKNYSLVADVAAIKQSSDGSFTPELVMLQEMVNGKLTDIGTPSSLGGLTISTDVDNVPDIRVQNAQETNGDHETGKFYFRTAGAIGYGVTKFYVKLKPTDTSLSPIELTIPVVIDGSGTTTYYLKDNGTKFTSQLSLVDKTVKISVTAIANVLVCKNEGGTITEGVTDSGLKVKCYIDNGYHASSDMDKYDSAYYVEDSRSFGVTEADRKKLPTKMIISLMDDSSTVDELVIPITQKTGGVEAFDTTNGIFDRVCMGSDTISTIQQTAKNISLKVHDSQPRNLLTNSNIPGINRLYTIYYHSTAQLKANITYTLTASGHAAKGVPNDSTDGSKVKYNMALQLYQKSSSGGWIHQRGITFDSLTDEIKHVTFTPKDGTKEGEENEEGTYYLAFFSVGTNGKFDSGKFPPVKLNWATLTIGGEEEAAWVPSADEDESNGNILLSADDISGYALNSATATTGQDGTSKGITRSWKSTDSDAPSSTSHKDMCNITGLTDRLEPDTWYTLTFWAKGALTNLTGTANMPALRPMFYSLGDVWGSAGWGAAMRTDCNSLQGTDDQNSDNDLFWATAGDGFNTITLTSSWTRYMFMFKTATELKGDILIGFRATKAGAYYVCQPQLEKGTVATAFCTGFREVTKQALLDVGVDIDGNGITLTGKTKIQDNSGTSHTLISGGKIQAEYVEAQSVEANMLATIPSESGIRIVINQGMMLVYGTAGIANIRFGVNEQGMSVLSYYNNDGEKLYDLGPDGVSKIDTSPERLRSFTASYLVDGAFSHNTYAFDDAQEAWNDAGKRKSLYQYFARYTKLENGTVAWSPGQYCESAAVAKNINSLYLNSWKGYKCYTETNTTAGIGSVLLTGTYVTGKTDVPAGSYAFSESTDGEAERTDETITGRKRYNAYTMYEITEFSYGKVTNKYYVDNKTEMN